MRILIIEDDKFYGRNLKRTIEKELEFEVDCVSDVKSLEQLNLNYELIISDIFMENYDEKYIEKNLIPQHIPIILITGFPDKELKRKLRKLNIVDFIIKTESNRFDQIIDKLKILNYTKNRSFLIVDDSKTATLINMLIIKKHYPMSKIYTAQNGIEALEKLKKEKDIKLILTDYEMPEMNGAEFIKKVRERYSFEDKIIIALSSASSQELSSTLLKIGANDFLRKPFNDEELVCRCDNNFKISMLIDEVKNLAFRDSLTNLYNRRYFFETAQKMFLTALRKKVPITILMADIDHFKKINDKYGHQMGDEVIKNSAKILKSSVRKNDIVARYGGEEFVVLLFDCNKENGYKVAEKIRKRVEESSLNGLKYTISIGVTDEGSSIDDMIYKADLALYEAKKERNKVVIYK